MPKYIVCTDEVHTVEYTVEAKDPSEAIWKVRWGGADPEDGVWLDREECQGQQIGSLWWVEEKYPDVKSPTPTCWDLVDEHDRSWENPGS